MTHADRWTQPDEIEFESLHDRISEAIKNIGSIDLAPLGKLSQSNLKTSTEPLQQTITEDLQNLNSINNELQKDFKKIEAARLAADIDEKEKNQLDKFLNSSKIDRSKLGKPPLSNKEDPLLDRERLRLDSGDGSEEPAR